MARGIKDKVAILGMGCSKFGERWDSGAEELMLEAYKECIKDAGIDQNQIQAAWFSTAIDEVHVGKSGIPMSTPIICATCCFRPRFTSSSRKQWRAWVAP